MSEMLNIKTEIKIRINKLISFRIDDDKIFKIYKAIWNQIKIFQDTQLNASSVYYDICLKPKQKHMAIKLILIFAV